MFKNNNQFGGSPMGSFMNQEPVLPFDTEKKYDLVVIGGGSGGLSCAFEAKSLGMSVIVFDHVTPSPYTGVTWGLGGTCVNVGCIPKKLFHIAAQMKDNYEPAEDFGYVVQKQKAKHDWKTLRDNVQNYIKGINFSYKSKLASEGIDYVNAKASFTTTNSVAFDYASCAFSGETKPYSIKGQDFVIATGGRPRGHPAVPTELTITSDELFSLEKDPGTTLVIGGGYIAIECAGFLNGLGKQVHLLNRSTFLRSMDTDIANRIVDEMVMNGVNVMTETIVKSAKRIENGKISVELNQAGKDVTLEVDTVLVAIGRDANTSQLGLKEIGVNTKESNGKILSFATTEVNERTNIDNIYALGDVLEGAPELMPVAQKSGKLLAQRLNYRTIHTEGHYLRAALRSKKMDYDMIPTTVFSPTEYSFVGLSEAEAHKTYSEEDVEIYHSETTPLQYSIHKANSKTAYMKVITCKEKEVEKVIGIHYYGPSADEMISGYALAMKLGLTKQNLDLSLGVHPSVSEGLFNLEVTKRSVKDFRQTDC